MSSKKNIDSKTDPQRQSTRREFIGDIALATASVTLAGCFPDVGGRWPQERANCVVNDPLITPVSDAVVAEVYDEASVLINSETNAMKVDATVAASMVSEVLRSLADNNEDYWSVLLPDYVRGMRIGIKVNMLNPQCANSLPVTRALVDDLQQKLGVPANDILVWDRRGDELTRSAFTQVNLGVPVMGTVTSTTDPSGPGYESDFCTLVNGKRTRLSRILTELTDVTINCPVLKTHDVSGVTGAMKNIYGIIDNPQDFHEDINETLPQLYALAPIRERLRLTLIDALIAVTLGSTSSPPDIAAKRLLATIDPVAADTRALALVNELRANRNPPQSEIDSKYTQWIGRAAEIGIGSSSYALRAIVR